MVNIFFSVQPMALGFAKDCFLHLFEKINNISIYIKQKGVSVCLSVCCHSPPKLLDGSGPNLAWTSPWTLGMSSTYFLEGTPTRGGIILEKLKILKTFPYCSK